MPVNAKAVVDIEVDDKQFKAFTKEFDRYSKVLAQTPKAWKAMSDDQKAMVQMYQRGTAALLAQNEVWRKNAAHAKDVSIHSERTAFHWDKIKEHGKKFGEFVLTAHERLMKWGGILAGVITGMGAASSWGLYGLGQWVRGGSISATKAGMSPGELRAVKGQFGDPFGIDVEGIAKSVTTAQGNAGSQQYAAIAGILGVDPNRLKGTNKVTAILEAIRNNRATPEMLEEQTGGVVRADETRAIRGIDKDVFAKSLRDTPKEARELEISPEHTRKWNEFLKEIDKAVETLKTILADNLTPLLEIFTKNSARWTSELRAFMEGDAFQDFIKKVPGYVEQTTKAIFDVFSSWKEIHKELAWWRFVKPTEDESKDFEKDRAKRWQDTKDFLAGGSGGAGVNTRGTDQPGGTGGAGVPASKVDVGIWAKMFGDAFVEAFEKANKALGFEKPKGEGSYQDGTPMVPKTGSYTLHRGEMVLPEADADMLRHSTMNDWKRSISGIESSGNYGIVNRVSGATGKYQVMPSNIADWTRQALGYSMSREQFRASPEAQERVFETIFGQYVARFGNPVDAASAWFSGQPLTGNRAGPDAMGTTVPGYVKQFLAGLGAHAATGRLGIDINDNTGGNVAMALSQMATVGIPLHPV